MRTKKGTVTSSKQDKTVVVTVHTYKVHPKYKKRYRVSSKFYAHDPENSSKEGDLVVIGETKPLSKLKRWKIIENFGGESAAAEIKEEEVEKAKEKGQSTVETKDKETLEEENKEIEESNK